MAKINPPALGRPFIPIQGGTYTPDTGFMDTALSYMRRQALRKKPPRAMPSPGRATTTPRPAPRGMPAPVLPRPQTPAQMPPPIVGGRIYHNG